MSTAAGAPGNRIAVRGLHVRLGGREVVHDVHLTTAAGEWLALIGPNGAGKTTVLRALAGLLGRGSGAKVRGEAEVCGEPIARTSPSRRARLLAYVPQAPIVPEQATALEYVLLGRTPHLGPLGRPGPHDERVARGALERLDLAGLADRPMGTLSGGERQRVSLARALAQQASVLVLDEPTSALDLGHQQQVLELVDGLRREDGLAVVTTLHDIQLAAQYADRLLLLADGRTAAEGPPADVVTADTLHRHYGARALVTPGADGRPTVRLVRPGQPAG